MSYFLNTSCIYSSSVFIYIHRKKLMFLQNQITTVSLLLTQKDTVDEDVCKNCDETDKIDDAAVINHVINEESAKPLQNKFKEIDEVTKPKGKRKMCKSDSELSFRNKVLITTKPKADQKKPTLYEKCRLPFETCED